MHEYQKQAYRKVGVIVALIVLPVGGFFAGMFYQKQAAGANPATTQNRPGGTGRFGALRGRAIGTVKAIDSGSITVTSRMDNTDKTYTITSNTTYKNGTSDAQASDIKVGDTVLVTLDSSDNTKAAAITVNPSFQRPNASTQGSFDSTPSSDSNAIMQ